MTMSVAVSYPVISPPARITKMPGLRMLHKRLKSIILFTALSGSAARGWLLERSGSF